MTHWLLQAVAVAVLAAAPLAAGVPDFRAHTIAEDLRGGYQVVPHDVDGDGKVDLIALASGMKELVWFRNPGWRRFVLAEGMERMINLAACPGVNEIVVASHFNNNPSQSIGTVTVLHPGEDRRQPWHKTDIDRLPTSHRLRCAAVGGSGMPVIVNAPLAGVKASAPDYRDRIPVVFYRPGVWRRETIGGQLQGVMHGIYIHDWTRNRRDDILTASFEGIHAYSLGREGKWQMERIVAGDPAAWPKSGSSDVAVGSLGRERFLASIEPWHGEQVAVYRQKDREWTRTVIDRSLTDGHTILTVDLDGDGRDEIVAGYRGGTRGVHIYATGNNDENGWRKVVLEQGTIAAAACAAVDLNEDGRPDLACIGQATTNLKWYENLSKIAP
jgi:hypothetical protein